MANVLVAVLGTVLGLAVAAWLVAAFVFDAPDLDRYDAPRPVPVGRSGESAEHEAVARMIATGLDSPPPGDRRDQLRAMRRQLDERGEAATIASTLTRVDAGGVPGEWAVAPNADPERRMLYLHGGGYVMGSARSHRPIASRLSEVSRSAVLSIDYRLMPESSRLSGIDDCRKAYRWILANGPDRESPPTSLVVAGDSSGGNLALVTLAWARDQGLRAADAAVVFSPQTDATLSSPSLARNVATDVMQGPMLGPLLKAPRVVGLWMSFLMNRINPRSRLVSPLLGDLSNLPPTLIQVSASEMFLDDAVRYANKANAQGSRTILQTWPHTLHAWQAFDTPETDEAFSEIEEFLAEYLARSAIPRTN